MVAYPLTKGYCPFGQFAGTCTSRKTFLRVFVRARFSHRPMLGRRCGVKELAEPLDRTPQLRGRLYTHFVHHLGAMRFDGALGNAEHVGDLLIRKAAHDERKYLTFARGHGFITSVPIPLMTSRFPRCGVARQRLAHSSKQLISLDWLGEEIYGTALHCAHRGGNITVAREEDHRQWFFVSGERLLQLQPVNSRHLQIEHSATSGRV